MLKFLDFIFYKTYNGYSNTGEEIPGVYALCLITLFPLLNISSLIFFAIDIFKIQNWDYSKGVLIGVFVIVFILNYIRIYKIVGLAKISEWYTSLSNAKKAKLGIYMWVYLFLSIIIMFASI